MERKSPEQAFKALQSAPVVHGVAQALESSLAVTSASIKHDKRDRERKSPEQAFKALQSAPVVHGIAHALESSLAVTSASIEHDPQHMHKMVQGAKGTMLAQSFEHQEFRNSRMFAAKLAQAKAVGAPSTRQRMACRSIVTRRQPQRIAKKASISLAVFFLR